MSPIETADFTKAALNIDSLDDWKIQLKDVQQRLEYDGLGEIMTVGAAMVGPHCRGRPRDPLWRQDARATPGRLGCDGRSFDRPSWRVVVAPRDAVSAMTHDAGVSAVSKRL